MKKKAKIIVWEWLICYILPFETFWWSAKPDCLNPTIQHLSYAPACLVAGRATPTQCLLCQCQYQYQYTLSISQVWTPRSRVWLRVSPHVCKISSSFDGIRMCSVCVVRQACGESGGDVKGADPLKSGEMRSKVLHVAYCPSPRHLFSSFQRQLPRAITKPNLNLTPCHERPSRPKLRQGRPNRSKTRRPFSPLAHPGPGSLVAGFTTGLH
jgi:hypothetical protein